MFTVSDAINLKLPISCSLISRMQCSMKYFNLQLGFSEWIFTVFLQAFPFSIIQAAKGGEQEIPGSGMSL